MSKDVFQSFEKQIFYYMILILIKALYTFQIVSNIANLIYHATVIFIIPSEIAKLK